MNDADRATINEYKEIIKNSHLPMDLLPAFKWMIELCERLDAEVHEARLAAEAEADAYDELLARVRA